MYISKYDLRKNNRFFGPFDDVAIDKLSSVRISYVRNLALIEFPKKVSIFSTKSLQTFFAKKCKPFKIYYHLSYVTQLLLKRTLA